MGKILYLCRATCQGEITCSVFRKDVTRKSSYELLQVPYYQFITIKNHECSKQEVDRHHSVYVAADRHGGSSHRTSLGRHQGSFLRRAGTVGTVHRQHPRAVHHHHQPLSSPYREIYYA